MPNTLVTGAGKHRSWPGQQGLGLLFSISYFEGIRVGAAVPCFSLPSSRALPGEPSFQDKKKAVKDHLGQFCHWSAGEETGSSSTAHGHRPRLGLEMKRWDSRCRKRRSCLRKGPMPCRPKP